MEVAFYKQRSHPIITGHGKNTTTGRADGETCLVGHNTLVLGGYILTGVTCRDTYAQWWLQLLVDGSHRGKTRCPKHQLFQIEISYLRILGWCESTHLWPIESTPPQIPGTSTKILPSAKGQVCTSPFHWTSWSLVVPCRYHSYVRYMCRGGAHLHDVKPWAEHSRLSWSENQSLGTGVFQFSHSWTQFLNIFHNLRYRDTLYSYTEWRNDGIVENPWFPPGEVQDWGSWPGPWLTSPGKVGTAEISRWSLIVTKQHFLTVATPLLLTSVWTRLLGAGEVVEREAEEVEQVEG